MSIFYCPPFIARTPTGSGSNLPSCTKGLVTNYGEGGLQNGRGGGGAREVLPLRKGGAEKVLAMLKGGHKKFWVRFYAVAWCFNHIVGGVTKKFPLFKRGGVKSFTLPWGGGRKKFRTCDFPHFVAPPLPVINDQSLTSCTEKLVGFLTFLMQI